MQGVPLGPAAPGPDPRLCPVQRKGRGRETGGTGRPETKVPAEGVRKTLRIDGMMCHHCENAVKNALEKLDFIEEAGADFEAGTAVVTLRGEADEEAIRKALAEEDYEYLGMS